ncbi:MAG: hypothetical protein IPM82_26125 [Saprospiraceae bacterium]|nr:hypothetical protein [Saprospiraceae bacterium]
MRLTYSLLTALLFSLFTPLFGQGNFWTILEESTLASRNQERWIVPEKYSSFLLDAASMRSALERVPQRFNTQGETAIVHLPMPDGSFEEFAIVEAPLMHPDLAARYREIRTFSGQGVTNPAAAAYLDWTPQGFHGMIIMPGKVFYIDPYFKEDNTVYVSYDRDDYFNEKSAEFSCMTEGEGDTQYVPSADMLPIGMNSRSTTNMLVYRIAFAATGEYTAYHGGTVPLALAAINTTLNRVRGIYETELAISFTLVFNNDLIIYTDATTDPYSNPPTLAENQSNTDAVIGSSNYDVGHVVSTGTGGVATLNGVCDSTKKARGMSATNNPKSDAFDVDYVAHEMGHQFSAHHTYNGSTGSCTASNRYAGTAFEPGSGSTIMSYAGLCGASQNLQRRGNAYFHLVSLGEITHYTTVGTGSTCPTSVPSGNNIPTLNANPTGMSGKYIPISTPFELTAIGSDDDNDELTYAWEEWDLGSQGAPSSSSTNAPMFRSFTPTTSTTRTFPILSDLLDNTTSIGEKLPSVTRNLNINCTVRDNRTVGGGYGADGIVLHVTNAAGPFAITSHNTAATLNGAITVTWDVAGTTAAPISCANVDVLLSLDGGVTFSNLTTATPNDGSQSVTLPNTATGNARIKVKCSDNVFFDINNADLRIAPSDANCSEKVTDGNMSNYVNWTEYSSNGYFLIDNWSNYYHNAIGSAWLGSVNNETSRLSQTITIPAGAHFANLEFWYRYDRTDCGGDVFNVKVNGSIVKSYNQCNDPGAHDWTRQLIDLSAYIGTSPTIMFECITNSIYPSDVYIDDASVYVCSDGAFSPLPVELMAFVAKADERNALLTWTTASESDNHGFEVEMQSENAGFQVVGFVPGQAPLTKSPTTTSPYPI